MFVISRHKNAVTSLFVLVTSLLLTVERLDARRLSSATSACPGGCFCNSASHIVYCSNRGLRAVPTRLPSGTRQLNLNGNPFASSVLRRSNLTGLVGLEELFLSECGLERIAVDAFRDLRSLKLLDLTNNQIARIEDTTFRDLHLEHLFLNGNRNLQLGNQAFVGMRVTGLYLNECTLRSIDLQVFAPLNGTLLKLRLDSNELTMVGQEFESLFRSLEHLRLGNNPLSCDCRLLWLKSAFDNFSSIFEGSDAPGCFSPQPLRGRSFSELSSTDFRCEPPTFLDIDAVIESERGHMTCRARGDPQPNLYWITPRGDSIRFPPRATDVTAAGASVNEATLDLSDLIRAGHDFSGQYFCLAVSEGGQSTFTFNVSWPHPNRARVTSSHSTTASTTPLIRVDDYFIDKDDDVIDLESSDAYDVSRRTSTPVTSRTTDDVSSNDVHFTHGDQQAPADSDEHLYTLLELVAAILGTFVGTLLLCFIVIPLLMRKCFAGEKDYKDGYEKPPYRDEPLYSSAGGGTLVQSPTPPPPNRTDYPYSQHYMHKMAQSMDSPHVHKFYFTPPHPQHLTLNHR